MKSRPRLFFSKTMALRLNRCSQTFCKTYEILAYRPVRNDSRWIIVHEWHDIRTAGGYLFSDSHTHTVAVLWLRKHARRTCTRIKAERTGIPDNHRRLSMCQETNDWDSCERARQMTTIRPLQALRRKRAKELRRLGKDRQRWWIWYWTEFLSRQTTANFSCSNNFQQMSSRRHHRKTLHMILSASQVQ